MRWDEWRGSLDGRPTMWIKRLLKFFGRRIDIHKFVKADDPECMHSHQNATYRMDIHWVFSTFVKSTRSPPPPPMARNPVFQRWSGRDLQKELTKYIDQRDEAMLWVGEIKAELLYRSIEDAQTPVGSNKINKEPTNG